jgi:RHS repeat-associated protein
VTGVNTPAGIDTYTYDPAGNRTTWTNADGADYSYLWDTQHRLTAATSTPGGTTNYLYDTDRQQILRKDPNGDVTLFLAGTQEIIRTANAAQTATRFYSIDGANVAVRTPTVVEWTFGDHHGSIHTTIDDTNTTKRTHYTPYGEIRAETNPAPTSNHRYLGQTDEPASNLNYLNNRYHDPTVGVFISVDPLAASTGEPYVYGSANPITWSDPLGLCADAGYGYYDDGEGDCANGNGVQNHYYVGPILPGWESRDRGDNLARQFGNAFQIPDSNFDDPHGWGICVGLSACTAAYLYFLHTGDMGGAKTTAVTYCLRNPEACRLDADIAAMATAFEQGLFVAFAVLVSAPTVGQASNATNTARSTSIVDDVIAETQAGTRNLTSRYTLTGDEALRAGERWVGSGYTEIGKPGSGVFRSADATRQFRIDNGSITGAHSPGVPHVHLETIAPGSKVPIVNNQIPIAG